MFRGEEIFLAGAAAEGDDVRVFAEEENVVHGAGFTRGDEALLELERGIPGVDAKIADEKRRHALKKPNR